MASAGVQLQTVAPADHGHPEQQPHGNSFPLNDAAAWSPQNARGGRKHISPLLFLSSKETISLLSINCKMYSAGNDDDGQQQRKGGMGRDVPPTDRLLALVLSIEQRVRAASSATHDFLRVSCRRCSLFVFVVIRLASEHWVVCPVGPLRYGARLLGSIYTLVLPIDRAAKQKHFSRTLPMQK
jgi:hypothetical protein